jgi:hypothetical protein
VELSHKLRGSFKKFPYSKICELHAQKIRLHKKEDFGLYDGLANKIIKENISYSSFGRPFGNGHLNVAETYDSTDSMTVEAYRKRQAEKQREKRREENQQDSEIAELKRKEREAVIDLAKEEQSKKDKEKKEKSKDKEKKEKRKKEFQEKEKKMSPWEEREYLKKLTLTSAMNSSYQQPKESKGGKKGKGEKKQQKGKPNAKKIPNKF